MSDRDGTWLGLPRRAKPLVRAGILLGIGLGGFFDGIVFHQILQWHHMLTSHPDPNIASNLPLNTLADGLFHAATYLFTVLGIVLLLRAWRQPTVRASGRALLGSVIVGWGAFNVVEGIVNHHLLGIHHVWPGGPGPGPVLLWDGVFLVWGLLFVGGGYAIVRRADSVSSEPAERAQPEETS